MCGNGHNKRTRSARPDWLSDEPVKRLHRELMDHAWAASRVTASKLEEVLVPSGATLESTDREKSAVEAN